MPLYDFECSYCGKCFESIEKINVKKTWCPFCDRQADRVFPKDAPNFNLKYNPRSDVCDWNGNTSQYYRLYNEAKDRGEKVRLPEEGE